MNKRLMKATIQILAFVSTIVSCGQENVGETVTRVNSPDNSFDAVLTREGGPATNPFVYHFFVVRKGAVPKNISESLPNATHVDDLGISWRDKNLIDVSYSHATIWHFTNRADGHDYQDIEIRLRPTGERALR